MVEATQVRMTSKEFLELPETNQIVELIDGEIIMPPAPEDAHQKVSGQTHLFLGRTIPGGELRYAPTDVYFDELNTVQPDIFWVSAENTSCHLMGRLWSGAPDLVVEVLSLSTSHNDYRKKYNLYEKYGGREYWIVDPIAKFVDVYRLEGGQFVRQGVFEMGKSFVSAVLGGQTVSVDVLFK